MAETNKVAETNKTRNVPWPETRRRAKKLAKIIGKTVGRTWDEAIREKAKAEAMKIKVRVEAEYAHQEARIPE